MPSDLPSWCRVVAGDGPSLVVAPHGGLCARDLLAADTAGALRGNDLHTADVAERLAARLGGTLLANHALDRNELDLNRLSEVAESAAWFLDVMHAHVARILARHAVAQVLVVHGWHVVQPSCDVGVGARLASAGDASPLAGRLTVSPDFVHGALESLRSATAAHGIRTTYGERWPAAHRNNVMQVFRRRRVASTALVEHPLGALAAQGKVEAVQLELGAPLRWPGAWRERFLDAATRAFGDGARTRRPASASRTESVVPPEIDATQAACVEPRAPRETTSSGERPPTPSTIGVAPSQRDAPSAGDANDAHPTAGVALQAFDEHAGPHGLGIVVGLGALSPDEVGARLLLLPGGQRMLLFTGHERMRPAGAGRVGGLAVERRADGLDIRFRGPVLDVPDASAYFRHEPAQLEARLIDVELELQFTACGRGTFGRVDGEARLDCGERWTIAASGFTDPVLARPTLADTECSLRLTATFGPDLGLSAALGGAHATVTRCTPQGAVVRSRPAVAIPELCGRRLPEPFDVALAGEPRLRCAPLGHVSIVRPTGGGRFARITFGAASFALDDGARGAGFYEYGAALDGAGGRNEDP